MKITKFLVDGQEAAVSKTALDTDVTGSLLPTPAAPVEENPSTDAGKVPTVANNGTYQLTTPSGSADVLNVDVVIDHLSPTWWTTGEAPATVSVSDTDIRDAFDAGKQIIITARYIDDSGVLFYGSANILLDVVNSIVFPVSQYLYLPFGMIEVTRDDGSSWVAKRIPLAPASSAPLLIPVTLDSAPVSGSVVTGTTPISESELLAAVKSGRPMQITFKHIDNGDEILVVNTALTGHALLDVADYWIDEKSASLFYADPYVTFTTSGSTTTVTMNPANSG
jgi:hypothetical protein